MKKLSYWAKNHKWTSRIFIIAGFLLLNTAGIVTGTLLNELNVTVPLFVFYLITIIYFIAFIFYPSKRSKRKLRSVIFYKRQKTCDVILAASAFAMIICISNGNGPKINLFERLYAATTVSALPSDSSARNYKSINAFSASMKDANGKTLSWKERKKLLKEQVHGIKKANDMSDGGKIGLIVLSALVALGLLALIAAAACDLSCSGSDAAALIVGVGGTALIVFLLIIAIRAITGKKKRKTNKQLLPNETKPNS